MGNEGGALQKRNELASELAKAASNILPGDYDDAQYEKPKILFLRLRQKDLKDETGKKIVRSAGGFRTGKVTDLAFDDREELNITVLGYRNTRTYFENLDDSKPTCDTNDAVRGSRERELNKDGRAVYGLCATCWYSQWGSEENNRQKCREGRDIFAIDWAHERPIILSLGPSSLRGWNDFSDFVADQARRFKDAKGRIPTIFHMLRVTVGAEYRDKPSAHFVATWNNPTALPLEIQASVAAMRAAAMDAFRSTEAEKDPEDFGGATPQTVPAEEAGEAPPPDEYQPEPQEERAPEEGELPF